MKKDTKITIRMSVADKREIKKFCRGSDESISRVLRRAWQGFKKSIRRNSVVI